LFQGLLRAAEECVGASLTAGVGAERPCVVAIDAAHAWIVAAHVQQTSRSALVVAPTIGRARSLVEQLRLVLEADWRVELFAERDALPYERVPTDSLTRAARLRALGVMVLGQRGVIVTTGRALLDRLASLQEARHLVAEVAVGSRIEPALLAKRLMSAGYRPGALVEAPGELSVRGDVLDVYPAVDARPVRIEFFGDEVESIRAFEPVTQRSGSPLGNRIISPASEVFLTEERSARIVGRLAIEHLREAEIAIWSSDLQSIAAGSLPEIPEMYGGTLGSESIIDYATDTYDVIAIDPKGLRATAEAIEQQALDIFDLDLRNNRIPRGLDSPIHPWSRAADVMTRSHGFDLQWRDDDDRSRSGDAETRERPAPFSLPPSFGGRLRTFIDDVAGASAAGDATVILSQQASRLSELFAERNLIVPIVREIHEPPPGGSILMVQGSGLEGVVFPCLAHALRIVTDQEITGWTRPRRPVRTRRTARKDFLSELETGRPVVHVEHGIGIYRGLVQREIDGVVREYLAIDYAETDKLFVPVEQADRVGKYVGVGEAAPTLHRLGSTEWARTRGRVRAEVRKLAEDLLALYAAREVRAGHAFAPDTVWQQEMEAAFPYVETPDQLTALADVKADMESSRPMDRLLCGDVGYGKTEVAIRAAFKAVMDGRQVAVLVPTTVLAQQHYRTFTERMQAYPVRIEMLSRFRSPQEQSRIVDDLTVGKIDICIGTHRLIQKDVAFKDLGLLIIDEEQRFGVGHKERLKSLRAELDVLTLTATPIPRTLHMSLAGVRDLSTMDTAPEDRLPVRTYVEPWDEGRVREAILREIDRGGQIFFVHNRVQTIHQAARRLTALVPTATFLIGHGQLPEQELERVMLEFAAGNADILVCTTIIESGLDIPNANTIIVDEADNFGLAQLYQLRGRVGRGASRAYAYFLYRRNVVLSEVAEKRLKAIFEANELGAGFGIAMRDLEIRGAGNLLGAEQSGHASAVGLNLYTELLAEAVSELLGRPIARIPDVSIDLPCEASIPATYVADEPTRIELYRRLAAARDAETLGALAGELRDRFGPVPAPVLSLLWLVQIRVGAMRAGIAQIQTTANEFVIRMRGEQPDRLKQAEREFAPFVRGGRTYLYLDRQGLGIRWREMLDRVVAHLDLALVPVGA